MTPLRIVYGPDHRLKESCSSVTEFGEELKTLTESMTQLMHTRNGIGLAAPQIGMLKNIIVMGPANRDLVFINSTITNLSSDTISIEEGCLSFPGLDPILVSRSNRVSLTYQTIIGETKEKELQFLEARVFQHEHDHLIGKTIFDHASSLKRSRYNDRLRKFKRQLAKQFNIK